MKKFLMLHYGYEEPTPEIMAAWQGWFAKVGDRFVDIGNPLGNCIEVTKTGVRELSPDMGAATGYSIISADSREDAERLLEGLPDHLERPALRGDGDVVRGGAGGLPRRPSGRR